MRMTNEERKQQHLDRLYDWVMDTKHMEIEDWCAGDRVFNKDTYEDCVEAYVQENEDELFEEYFKLNP